MATATLSKPITTQSVETTDVATQIGWVHATFYFVAGLWPLVSLGTFNAVTGGLGPSALVQTIGALMVATSVGLFVALKKRELTSPIVAVAMADALFLAGFDLYYLLTDQFTVVHLADLCAQAGLFLSWLVARLPAHRTP